MISRTNWLNWILIGVLPAAMGVVSASACAVGEVVGGGGGDTCPLTHCGTSCVDTSVDSANCGACGHACEEGEDCVAGACATTCPPAQTLCGSACADTSVDLANCGACGHACMPGEVCSKGACAPTCGTGTISCSVPGMGDAGTKQICVDPTSDSHHCGGCDTVCQTGELCSASMCVYPTSCADVLAKGGPAVDGSYVIQPANKKPFTVYCAGMTTATPKEYLTLLHTHGSGASASNVSAYDKATCHCSDDMHRYFEKVRIDPNTLVVDRTDATFAANVTADPTCWAAQTGVCGLANSLLVGQAGNCISAGTPEPGNIDLGGTTFSIDPGVTFVPSGFKPYGSSTFSPDRKKVDFTGGGYCGGTDPSPSLLLKQD